MPKNYFQFKQFGVSQEGSTLKVCTDSCLFGAWAATTGTGKKVVDIGTGTGLLALMYAQKHPSALISALEIDHGSALLARANFRLSPWSENLQSIHTSLQEFSKVPYPPFETILCNPPFFEKQLTSRTATDNLAKHSSHLSKEELAEGIASLLVPTGEAFLLLPPLEAERFGALAEPAGLFLAEKIMVKNFEDSLPFRIMARFKKVQEERRESEMVIYAAPKTYTASFIDLLKEYYLYL